MRYIGFWLLGSLSLLFFSGYCFWAIFVDEVSLIFVPVAFLSAPLIYFASRDLSQTRGRALLGQMPSLQRT